jgi:starch synthase (maltosyl-transferring)
MCTDGRSCVVIERVRPEIDCGAFPIKRVPGEPVVVEADAFADGHDQMSCEVLYRHSAEEEWSRSRMKRVQNDRWRGEFSVSKLERYEYTIEGWIDRFGTWRFSSA